jgi:hypothetical protein
MVMAEFESFCTVRFITTNARWAGGNGCETAEELMAKAVRELPESSDLLGTLLIEIIEEMEEASVSGGGRNKPVRPLKDRREKVGSDRLVRLKESQFDCAEASFSDSERLTSDHGADG